MTFRQIKVRFVQNVEKISGVKRIRSIYYKNIELKKHYDIETVFTRRYKKYYNNRFNGLGSISGSGSDFVQTKIIRKKLPNLFREMKILTVLDIPCGDFYWMRNVNLNNIKYLGGDIVKNIIQQNRVRYQRKNIFFYHQDLTKDNLPRVDIVICRDCLVHFSFNDIFSALKNICCSKSTYLLTTFFTARKSNRDILTGDWRPLNLVMPPFSLPNPIRVINEGCSEKKGLYVDKSLGLWKIKDIDSKLHIDTSQVRKKIKF